MIGIYKLTSPSGKSYIGQSINIKRRLKSYKKLNCKKQTYLYNSLCKYGFDSFTVEILQECDQNELNKLEEFYINKYNTLTPIGYNLKEGGLSNKFTQSAKNNTKLGYIKKYKSLIDLYDEPLFLFDNSFNLIKQYSNLGDASFENNLNPSDLYYKACIPNKKNDKIWIFVNSRNLKNNFGLINCNIYQVYEKCYPLDLISKI